MKFSEMYFKHPTERVFDILIGNTVVRKDFDVVKLAGEKFAAHEEYVEINIKEGAVKAEGKTIEGALNENGRLELKFKKGKADNPIVQGIIIYNDKIEGNFRLT